jgi:hypothetical protein
MANKSKGSQIGTLAGIGIGAMFGPAGVGIGAQLGGAGGSLLEGIFGDNTPNTKITFDANRSSNTRYSGGNTGIRRYMKGGAIEFSGPSHEYGGIDIGNGNEVEGGETMQYLPIKSKDRGSFYMKGGKVRKSNKKSPYVFSKRVSIPGTNTTFADRHKQLVKNDASQEDILSLARLQEDATGRTSNPNKSNRSSKGDTIMGKGGPMLNKKYQTGGTIDDPEKNQGRFANDPILNFLKKANQLPNKMFGRFANWYADRELNSELPQGVTIGSFGGTTPRNMGQGPVSTNEPEPDTKGAINRFFNEGTQPNTSALQQKRDRLSGNTSGDVSLSGSQNRYSMRNNSPFRPQTQNNTQPASTGGGGNRQSQPQTQSQPQSRALSIGDIPGAMSAKQTTSLPSSLGEFNLTGSTASTPRPLSANSSAPPTPNDSGQSFAGSIAPYAGDIANIALGLFGGSEIDVPDQRRIRTRGSSLRHARQMPTDVDVSPQERMIRESFRTLAAIPGASMNERLAAHSGALKAFHDLQGQKRNQENQLKAGKQQLLTQTQASLDSRDAQIAAQQEGQRFQAETGAAQFDAQQDISKQQMLAQGAAGAGKTYQMLQRELDLQENEAIQLETAMAGLGDDERRRIVERLASVSTGRRKEILQQILNELS